MHRQLRITLARRRERLIAWRYACYHDDGCIRCTHSCSHVAGGCYDYTTDDDCTSDGVCNDGDVCEYDE